MRFDLIYIASLAITWGLCIALYYFLRIPGLPWLGTGAQIALILYMAVDLVKQLYFKQKAKSRANANHSADKKN